MRLSPCLLMRRLYGILISAVCSTTVICIISSFALALGPGSGSAVLFWLRLCLGPQHHRTTTQPMSSHSGSMIETLQITRYLEQFSECFPVSDNTSDSDLSLRFEAVIWTIRLFRGTITQRHCVTSHPTIVYGKVGDCIKGARYQALKIFHLPHLSPSPDFTVSYDLNQTFQTP